MKKLHAFSTIAAAIVAGAVQLAVAQAGVTPRKAGTTVSPITTSSPDGSSAAVVGTTASPSDQDLLQRVVDVLSTDAALRGAFIGVAVDGGTVRLHGTANTPVQAARAGEVAASVAGSVRVANEVRTVQ